MFVIDSSVLIDYWMVRRTVLSLIAKHLGPVVVPEPILGEVDGLERKDCIELGLQVAEHVWDDYTLEVPGAVSGLSDKDLVCLRTAIRLKAVCLTNDKRMRETCKSCDHDTMWGFRPMFHLVKKGMLDSAEAILIAREIQGTNTRIAPTVVDAFQKKLAELDKPAGGKRRKK